MPIGRAGTVRCRAQVAAALARHTGNEAAEYLPMAKRIILGNKPARRLQSSSERERGEKAGGAEGTYSPLLLRGGEVAAHAHRTTAYGQGSTGGSHWPRPVRPHTSRSPGESTADTTTEIHPAPESHACQRPARPLAGRPTDARTQRSAWPRSPRHALPPAQLALPPPPPRHTVAVRHRSSTGRLGPLGGNKRTHS